MNLSHPHLPRDGLQYLLYSAPRQLGFDRFELFQRIILPKPVVFRKRRSVIHSLLCKKDFLPDH